jgi:hypothetical protein
LELCRDVLQKEFASMGYALFRRGNLSVAAFLSLIAFGISVAHLLMRFQEPSEKIVLSETLIAPEYSPTTGNGQLKTIEESGDKVSQFFPISELSVFYHILNIKGDDSTVVHQRVKEQMQYFNSIAPVSVYYTTVGNATFDHQRFQSLCHEKELSCRHLEKIKNANTREALETSSTMRRLHEYCTAFPSHRVMYLRTEENDLLRRHAIAAVTNAKCTNQQLQQKDHCDVCGLLALPFPFLHYPSNQFVARCSYVNRLLDPELYERRMGEVTHNALSRRSRRQFVMNTVDAPYHYPVAKSAAPHWITSYPNNRICDLSISPKIEYWKDSARSENEFELQAFPRHNIKAEWSYLKAVDWTLLKRDWRLRDYFMLAGNIFMWFELYGKAPPDNGWQWSFYPDGEMWLGRVQEHGFEALDEVLQWWIAKDN